ncbi:cell division protein ZapE, partial [Pseudanabaena biceps]|nr:cell division protein ZapE [Pseudanabaena biceps]
MPSALRKAYAERLETGRLKHDPAQTAALDHLEALETRLRRRGLFGGRPKVRGLYLWGGVGRGKSMLMDLFYAGAPEPRRKRAHFHAFMARVHDLIRQWREGDAAARRRVFGQHRGDDPIGPVADLIAREARLLCFDELQVTDIADAMILGRLFEALFDQGVVLAVTSNREPGDLYRDGINRQLFLPFIDLIRDRCEVVEVAGPQDWRVGRLGVSRVWYAPADDIGRRQAFDHLWQDLRGDEPEEPAVLRVDGREVVIDRTVGGMARASFESLCARPLGPHDYLALAERFHTLFLEDLPLLDEGRHGEARRLVTLIDALYEAKV